MTARLTRSGQTTTLKRVDPQAHRRQPPDHAEPDAVERQALPDRAADRGRGGQRRDTHGLLHGATLDRDLAFWCDARVASLHETADRHRRPPCCRRGRRPHRQRRARAEQRDDRRDSRLRHRRPDGSVHQPVDLRRAASPSRRAARSRSPTPSSLPHTVLFGTQPVRGLPSGARETFTAPSTPGPVQYICTLHQGMSGVHHRRRGAPTPTPNPTPTPTPTPTPDARSRPRRRSRRRRRWSPASRPRAGRGR